MLGLQLNHVSKRGLFFSNKLVHKKVYEKCQLYDIKRIEKIIMKKYSNQRQKILKELEN